METERRFVANQKVECRADGDSRSFEGYGAVFYSADDPGTEFDLGWGAKERIMPGAFDRAVREGDDVRGLFNHDPDHVLGRTESGTMTLSIDNSGLRYEIDAPDTTLARDLAKSIERGDITGSSFSFRVTDSEWVIEDGIDIRLVRGVQLFDVGPVTYPAYEGTSTGVRSKQAIDELKEIRNQRDGIAAEESKRGHAARTRQLRLKALS